MLRDRWLMIGRNIVIAVPPTSVWKPMPVPFLWQYKRVVENVPVDRLFAEPRTGYQHSGFVEHQDAVCSRIEPLGKKRPEDSVTDQINFVRGEEAVTHHTVKPLKAMILAHDKSNSFERLPRSTTQHRMFAPFAVHFQQINLRKTGPLEDFLQRNRLDAII